VLKRIGVLGVVVVAISLSVQAAAPLVAARARGTDISLKRLPLWRALPTRAFIELGGETTSRFTWEAFAFRASGSQNPTRVCLEIVSARARRPGVLSVERASPECGRVGPRVEAPVVVEAGFQEPARTAVVVATGTDAVTAKAVLSRGADRHGKFRVLAARRAAKGRVNAFRYALLVPRPEVCIDQIIGEGRTGSPVFETPKGRCAGDGS
jgi:hypothetical protein